MDGGALDAWKSVWLSEYLAVEKVPTIYLHKYCADGVACIVFSVEHCVF